MEPNIIQMIPQQKWLFSGDLTMPWIMNLLQRGLNLVANHQQLEFDFSQVNRCDSSSLAALIIWLNAAHHRGKTIIFSQLTDTMRSMASLSDLSDILPIDKN